MKDDKTNYSFDTAQIEHLNYPRDLRFSQIVDFKTLLSDKVRGTYKKATEDKNYTTFLKNFGEFKVAKIDQTEVTAQEFILDELKSLRASMSKLERQNRYGPLATSVGNKRTTLIFRANSPLSEEQRKIIIEVLTSEFIQGVTLEFSSGKRFGISFDRALSFNETERVRFIVANAAADATLIHIEQDVRDTLEYF